MGWLRTEEEGFSGTGGEGVLVGGCALDWIGAWEENAWDRLDVLFELVDWEGVLLVRVAWCGIVLNEEGFRLGVEEHALGLNRIWQWLWFFLFDWTIVYFSNKNIISLPLSSNISLFNRLNQYRLSNTWMQIIYTLRLTRNNLCTEFIIKLNFFMLYEIRMIGLRDEQAFFLFVARFSLLVYGWWVYCAALDLLLYCRKVIRLAHIVLLLLDCGLSDRGILWWLLIVNILWFKLFSIYNLNLLGWTFNLHLNIFNRLWPRLACWFWLWLQNCFNASGNWFNGSGWLRNNLGLGLCWLMLCNKLVLCLLLMRYFALILF